MLTPGGGYRLPPVGVRNPGDEVTSYKLLVTSAQGQDGTPVPADWFAFEPREVTLRPGETKKVQARLSLPTSADPGDYEGLLAAQIVTEGEAPRSVRPRPPRSRSRSRRRRGSAPGGTESGPPCPSINRGRG